MQLNLAAYLTRVGLLVPPAADLAGLITLQRAQHLTIPFENFDIFLGRGISLEPAVLFDKLITRRRGGYCFEVNELFLQAALALGFEARAALARVRFYPEPSGLTHQVTLVTLQGQTWLADVGFGAETPRRPLRLLDGEVVEQDGYGFQLRWDPPFGWLLSHWQEGAWQPLYSFEERLVLPSDRALGNHFTSSHPHSFFTWARVATLARPWGQISLRNQVLSITKDGQRQEEQLPEDDRFLVHLRELFGLELQAPFAALKALHPEPST